MCSYVQDRKPERQVYANRWEHMEVYDIRFREKNICLFLKIPKSYVQEIRHTNFKYPGRKNYSKWHTTNLVGILYIRILTIQLSLLFNRRDFFVVFCFYLFFAATSSSRRCCCSPSYLLKNNSSIKVAIFCHEQFVIV